MANLTEFDSSLFSSLAQKLTILKFKAKVFLSVDFTFQEWLRLAMCLCPVSAINAKRVLESNRFMQALAILGIFIPNLGLKLWL